MKTQAVDPVCGMTVKEPAAHRHQHGDTEYLFCSSGCLQEFQSAPGRFVKDEAPAAQPKEIPVWNPQPASSEDASGRWTNYIPLIVLVVLMLASATARQVAHGGWDGMIWMHDFMGFFLVVFSMFKFFNLDGFADGFQMYDLLAKRQRAYAYAYPFIEAALGLAYLAHWQPRLTYGITIAVTVFGSLGVLNALRKRMNVHCACMGTVLKVPLSTVALVEDLGMAVMAAVMLLQGW